MTDGPYPTTRREIKIGRTLYHVTSVFTGEKELASTLEKLIVQRILDEMEASEEKALPHSQ